MWLNIALHDAVAYGNGPWNLKALEPPCMATDKGTGMNGHAETENKQHKLLRRQPCYRTRTNYSDASMEPLKALAFPVQLLTRIANTTFGACRTTLGADLAVLAHTDNLTRATKATFGVLTYWIYTSRLVEDTLRTVVAMTTIPDSGIRDPVSLMPARY